MKKVLYIIKLNFLKEETRLIIKCVTWILFQVFTVGIFMKYVTIDKWLWQFKK